MIKAGITGGIGSGKTTVSKLFQSYGAYLLNADDLAKKIMTENETVKKQIIKVFGQKSYKEDGSLNREYLAEQAFKNERVEELNRIVHPKIPNAVNREMAEAEKEGYEVFIYEAAILLQNLRPDELDYVILVLADEEKRIQRVQKRDDVKRESVADRMQHQQDFRKLTHLADIVIENNGTLEELKEQANRVYYDILTAQ